MFRRLLLLFALALVSVIGLGATGVAQASGCSTISYGNPVESSPNSFFGQFNISGCNADVKQVNYSYELTTVSGYNSGMQYLSLGTWPQSSHIRSVSVAYYSYIHTYCYWPDMQWFQFGYWYWVYFWNGTDSGAGPYWSGGTYDTCGR